MRVFERIKDRVLREAFVFSLKGRTPIDKALRWLLAYRVTPEGVIPSYTFQRGHAATREETACLLSALYGYGEKELALEMARWGAAVQGKDGSAAAMDGVPCTFAAAQVIRGFLTVLDDLPELEKNLRRACDFVESQVDEQGVIRGNALPEYGNLYVLPPMQQAGRRLNEPRYMHAAKRAMDKYRQRSDLVDFKPDPSTLSHHFGYMMEALVDLGEVELARTGLAQAARVQAGDGAIPAYPGAQWTCSTGLAQLALAWYKLGDAEPANRALDYMETLQNPSGGFFGGYGKGAQYFPHQEISWAATSFLDAYLWRVKLDFDDDSVEWFGTIKEDDGRVQAILGFLGDCNGRKVIDIGCGKGRFIRVLQSRFPQGQYYGMDISAEMLKHCPEGVVTSVGNMLNIQYPDSTFDCVYSVEAIEHAINIEGAVREMVRILKPRGRIVIVDKNVDRLGALKLKSWEKWFDRNEIVALLRKYGVSATGKLVAHGEHARPDGLFVAWGGMKNA